jgi:hypothetical protein
MSRYAITMTLTDEGYECQSVVVEGDNVPYDLISGVVGGYIERIRLVIPDTSHGPGFPLDMWVNEEGALMSLPPNPVASIISVTLSQLPYLIVGNVVFTNGGDDAEGNTVPLSQYEAESVASMILNASARITMVQGHSL